LALHCGVTLAQHVGEETTADAELANAINLRDDLAKKIYDAQQQIDEGQRELDRVKAFIAQLVVREEHASH
jgi:uncharacterized protein HemY